MQIGCARRGEESRLKRQQVYASKVVLLCKIAAADIYLWLFGIESHFDLAVAFQRVIVVICNTTHQHNTTQPQLHTESGTVTLIATPSPASLYVTDN